MQRIKMIIIFIRFVYMSRFVFLLFVHLPPMHCVHVCTFEKSMIPIKIVMDENIAAESE